MVHLFPSNLGFIACIPVQGITVILSLNKLYRYFIANLLRNQNLIQETLCCFLYRNYHLLNFLLKSYVSLII